MNDKEMVHAICSDRACNTCPLTLSHINCLHILQDVADEDIIYKLHDVYYSIFPYEPDITDTEIMNIFKEA